MQTLVTTLRGLEAKHEAERGAVEARQRSERARHAEEARALEAAGAAARERAGRLQTLMELLATECLALWQGSALKAPAAAAAAGDDAAGGSGGAAGAAEAGEEQLRLPEQCAPARWLFRHKAGVWRTVEGVLRELGLDANPAAVGKALKRVLPAPCRGSTTPRTTSA